MTIAALCGMLCASATPATRADSALVEGQEDLNTESARLTQIISAAGAPLAREPCQPNFSIIVTSDPDRVLEAWYARNKQLFGDATPSQIRRFLESSGSRPIRVWRNIVDLDADIGSAPSILRLFVPSPTPPAELSSWDAAFIKALYQSDQTSRSQRHDIAERVMNEISHSR
jgi:hypothetical protein